MRPPASIVMTPVATRSSTASVNRRRSSTSACLRSRSALDCSRARRLDASSSAIVLNESTSDPNSSTVSRSTRCSKWPAPISRAAAASSWTGRVMRLARYRPIQVALTRIISVTIRKNDR